MFCNKGNVFPFWAIPLYIHYGINGSNSRQYIHFLSQNHIDKLHIVKFDWSYFMNPTSALWVIIHFFYRGLWKLSLFSLQVLRVPHKSYCQHLLNLHTHLNHLLLRFNLLKAPFLGLYNVIVNVVRVDIQPSCC